MKIENKSVLNQANRICPILRGRGDNLSTEHSATILVRALLEELGDELLTLEDESSKAERARLVALVKPFCTAAKNFQDTYLADTTGTDGKPLMPKTAKSASTATAEFA